MTKVLNGQANIGIDQLEKYAKCFDMTLEAFLYPLVEDMIDSDTMELLSIFESCSGVEKAEIVVFIVKYKCRKLQNKNVGRCNCIL